MHLARIPPAMWAGCSDAQRMIDRSRRHGVPFARVRWNSHRSWRGEANSVSDGLIWAVRGLRAPPSHRTHTTPAPRRTLGVRSRLGLNAWRTIRRSSRRGARRRRRLRSCSSRAPGSRSTGRTCLTMNSVSKHSKRHQNPRSHTESPLRLRAGQRAGA